MGARTEALARISQLGNQGLDVATFLDRASRAVSSAVPSSSVCWYTLDPASVLITSYHCRNWDVTPELEREMLTWEYLEDDFNKAADVALSPRGVQTLAEVTAGEPARSRAYREWMRPNGLEHEALVALRTRGGTNWGVMSIDRAAGEPNFGPGELDFLRALAPFLALGVQRGMLVGEASDAEGPEAPGLLVLNHDWTVHSATPGVERWLAELPGRWTQDGLLPPSVVAVAARALRTAEDADQPGEVAIARLLTSSGRWIVLHGASMVGDGHARAAVIIEPAGPARISGLLMTAYGLTEREEQVARLVLRGASTGEMAATLGVSQHTIQEHLKSIFEKTGVHSRRELVGKVFFAHYEPRVDDNHDRMLAAKAVRGGPWQESASAQPRRG